MANVPYISHTSPWQSSGRKLMRFEVGHRYPSSKAAKGRRGRWSAAVFPPTEGVRDRWHWAVTYPGHRSPTKRKNGFANGLWDAVTQADDFARAVGLEPQGELDDQTATEFLADVSAHEP